MDPTIDRARRVARRYLDSLLDEVGKLIELTPPDKAAATGKWRLVENEYEKLKELDQQARDYLLTVDVTEDVEDKEVKDAGAYHAKVETMRAKLDDIFAPATEVIPQSSSASVIMEGKSSGYGIKLPKYDIPKFDGSLVKWLGFWAAFKNIDECAQMDGSMKFNYLKSSLVVDSPPYELMCDLAPTNENYNQVVEKLKEEYGNTDILLQVYISEVLKLAINSASGKEKLDSGKLYRKVDSHFRALQSLNLDKADPATWLYPLIESSMPRETLSLWMRSSEYQEKGTKERTRVHRLLEFWRKEESHRRRIEMAETAFQGEEKVDSISTKRRYTNERDTEKRFGIKKSRQSEPIPTLRGFQNLEKDLSGRENLRNFSNKPRSSTSPKEQIQCAFCKKIGHLAGVCRTAKKMTLGERKKIVTTEKLCWNCFGKHFLVSCTVKSQCPHCGMRHHPLMCHREKSRSEGRQDDLPAPVGGSSATSASNVVYASRLNTCLVSLQTVQAYVQCEKKKIKARLFFDVGSQRSYILQSTAEFLGLKPKGAEVVMHELFGGSRTEKVMHKLYDVDLSSMETGQEGTYHCRVELREQNNISSSIARIPTLTVDEHDDAEKLGIVFSDVGDDLPPIDVLIGADLFGKLLTGDLRPLTGGRVAIRTKFGWSLVGENNGNKFLEWYNKETVTAMSAKDFAITQLWDLDTIGVREPSDVKSKLQEEHEAQQQFLKTIRRNEDGRYVVKLPRKEGHPPLPDNLAEAKRRLKRTVVKLKEVRLFETYNKLFQDWEKEGFIEEINESASDSIVHYIPHRAVIKEDSLTTPVRPVFDASCKIGRVSSLNDCLHKGTNYILKIPKVLLGFRINKVGFVSDIRKAFQMIEVAEEDRNVMRFLWLTPNGETKIYRHKRVMFGANCSPFILGATLEHHLNSVTEHKEVGQKLLQAMYVDNCCSSESSFSEYVKFRDVATQLMAECKMDLRMWMSNRDSFEDPQTHTISVLGMMWDRQEDCLFVKTEGISIPEKITKRTILSSVQKVFDPIGITSPALIPIKNILQELFQLKVKWDNPTSEKLANMFQKWLEELPYLQQIRIPRWIAEVKPEQGQWSIHVFTDASNAAYSTVLYLRVQDGERVTVRFLTAKARVSPIKRVTIPRLELMSCLIGARVAADHVSYLGIDNVEIALWSDSTTALSWIRRDERWGTFVGNRVTEINRLTNQNHWKHVPGIFNPADLPSRGCTPYQLFCSRWWEGPSWLLQPDLTCTWEEQVDENLVQQEKRVTAVSLATMSAIDVQKQQSANILDGGKQRSFTSWVREVAYLKRFCFNLCAKKRRQEKRSGALTYREVTNAEITLIKVIQQDAFKDKDKKELHGLDTFVDENGVICVRSRVVYRDDLIVSRKPWLVPGKHPLIQQLIMDYHHAYLHAGVGFLQTKLRKRYYILKERKSVKRVVSRCYRCRRLSSRPFQPVTGPLTLDRIKDCGVFETTGVDLAGPLYLKNGKKVWIVIYTCAVYRAVYLDLVDSTSTKAFIKSLGGFIKYHRRPETIYSDNGTNFRGCHNLFRSYDWDEIQKTEPGVKPIRWRFNPPGGPWWGAWWERLIRIVKNLLHKSVGRNSLNRAELEKTLKVIEDIMNDRPLTYVSEDPNDLQPLTPNTFLRPFGTSKFPEGHLSDAEKLRVRYKYMTTLWGELKQRFQREYLALLVSKSRKKPTRPMKEGELVVIGSEQQKRWEWPLGRVVEIYQGPDHVGRVAKVRVGYGELVRPVQKLHPLEMDAEAEERHVMVTRSKSKNLPDN